LRWPDARSSPSSTGGACRNWPAFNPVDLVSPGSGPRRPLAVAASPVTGEPSSTSWLAVWRLSRSVSRRVPAGVPAQRTPGWAPKAMLCRDQAYSSRRLLPPRWSSPRAVTGTRLRGAAGASRRVPCPGRLARRLLACRLPRWRAWPPARQPAGRGWSATPVSHRCPAQMVPEARSTTSDSDHRGSPADGDPHSARPSGLNARSR
jgi:hypothetical protein